MAALRSGGFGGFADFSGLTVMPNGRRAAVTVLWGPAYGFSSNNRGFRSLWKRESVEPRSSALTKEVDTLPWWQHPDQLTRSHMAWKKSLVLLNNVIIMYVLSNPLLLMHGVAMDRHFPFLSISDFPLPLHPSLPSRSLVPLPILSSSPSPLSHSSSLLLSH